MPDWFDLLPRGLQWKWAKRRGERPACEECGEPASWYTTHSGYTCIMCEEQRSASVSMLRELEPRDYLDD